MGLRSRGHLDFRHSSHGMEDALAPRMKKTSRRLGLARETLRGLSEEHLGQAGGAGDYQVAGSTDGFIQRAVTASGRQGCVSFSCGGYGCNGTFVVVPPPDLTKKYP